MADDSVAQENGPSLHRRNRRSLAASSLLVVAVALTLRLVYQHQFGATPLARISLLDAALYVDWATAIAGGDWLGGSGDSFFVEPGYAYALALLIRLGAGLAGVQLAQALAGTATALLAMILGRQLGGTRAGLIAGLLTAAYLPLIYFEGFQLKTTLEVLLSTAALVFSIHLARHPAAGNHLYFALGALCGTALVVRSNFLLSIPIFIGAPLILRARHLSRSGAALTAAALVPAALFACAGLAPLPAAVAWRNHAVAGEWRVLPWSSGINFYIGNGPNADGVDPTQPFAPSTPGDEGRASRNEASRRAGRALTAGESSQFWWRETTVSIAAAPAKWLTLLLVKLRVWWHHYEFTDNVSLYFVRELVPLLHWPLAGFWLVGPLGLAGLAAACLRWREPAWYLAAAQALLSIAGVVFFHVAERYRLAAVPVLLALGVAGLANWRQWPRPSRLLLGVALALGIIVTNVLPNPVAPSGQNLASHHEMMGVATLAEGDRESAERSLRQALALNPSLPDVRFHLAHVLRLRGDRDGAETLARQSLATSHVDIRARMQLAEILLDAGRAVESAGEFALAAEQLAAAGGQPSDAMRGAARALHAAQDNEAAQARIAAALALTPDDPAALELAGDIARARGDTEAATEFWRRSLAIRPGRELARKLAAIGI